MPGRWPESLQVTFRKTAFHPCMLGWDAERGFSAVELP